MRKGKLVHLTRGDSLAVFADHNIEFDTKEWLEAHAEDALPPGPDADADRHRRHAEWTMRRQYWDNHTLQQLRRGEVVATGYQLPIAINHRRQPIPRHLWDFLIPDFLNSTASGQGLTIVQIEAMDAPLPGSVPHIPKVDRTPQELITLSEDNAVFRVNDERFMFRGDAHRLIMRRLFDNYQAGTPELTRRLLAKANSGCTSIAQAFRGYPQWPRLHRHITTSQAFCYLDPCFS